MTTKLRKTGLAAAAAGVAFMSQTAFANLTGHGAAFHNYNAGEDTSIDYVSTGVRNLAQSSRFVIASVPFTKTANTVSDVTFNVEGKNQTRGAQTSFTLAAYESGIFRSSVNFTTTGASAVGYYNEVPVLKQISMFSRIYLLALLPGDSNSVIYGVTQNQ